MSQINISREPPERVESSGDRAAAAGINLITVLIVLVVLVVLAWYLFTGPLRSAGSSSSTTNININPAPTTVNVNPPSQQNAPVPTVTNPGGVTPAPSKP